MPTYKSFKDFAVQQLANFANATDANKVLRQAVIQVVPEMKRRIQNEGKNSAGEQMHTKSSKAYGAYSKAYGKKREKKGRQTAIVDLTFNGDMMRSLKPGPTGPNSYGIGFLNDAQAEIAGYNEQNFGEIFGVSAYELQVSLTAINKEAQKLLSK
jgi:hypothetical protein